MFENIMGFFKKLNKKTEQLESKTNKDEAKERLHLVLMQDRANVSADFLDMMRQEIIDVIKKYIDVDEKEIDVRLTNKQNSDGTTGAPALYANIPIISIKNDKKTIAYSGKLSKNSVQNVENSSEKENISADEVQNMQEEKESAKNIDKSDIGTESTKNANKPDVELENKENTNKPDVELKSKENTNKPNSESSSLKEKENNQEKIENTKSGMDTSKNVEEHTEKEEINKNTKSKNSKAKKSNKKK